MCLLKNFWSITFPFKVKVKVALSLLTLCYPVVYIVYGVLQARMLELGSLSLLQGIFPTQGLNPGLPHCWRILYQLSDKGSALPFKGFLKLR